MSKRKIISCFLIVVLVVATHLFVEEKNNHTVVLKANEKDGYNISYNEKSGTYSYQIYSVTGKILDEEKKLYREPCIESTDEDILHISLSAGTNVRQEWFVNRKTEEKSEIFENVCAVQGETIAFMELDDELSYCLAIMDIFDESKLYLQIKRDFTPLATPDLIIENAEFTEESSLKITYLKGEDEISITEIITW